jgi:hypothetical protein
MNMILAGIGTALPPHRISQSDAAEIAKQYSCQTTAQERLFLTLYRRAGVDNRNCVVMSLSEGRSTPAIILHSRGPHDAGSDAGDEAGRSAGRGRESGDLRTRGRA